MPEVRLNVASAFAAAAEDELARWVGDFSRAGAATTRHFAAGLAQREHWWLGPLWLPLDRLAPLAGTDDDALCPVDEDEWEGEVGAMEDSIEEGWDPPPLLAQFDAGRLLLQDGNHRYEALTREGATHTWVLLWFDDPADQRKFRDRVRAFMT